MSALTPYFRTKIDSSPLLDLCMSCVRAFHTSDPIAIHVLLSSPLLYRLRMSCLRAFHIFAANEPVLHFPRVPVDIDSPDMPVATCTPTTRTSVHKHIARRPLNARHLQAIPRDSSSGSNTQVRTRMAGTPATGE